jgi:hypothetical protein
MADYYTIIAKAVEALDPNTGEARRRLYERARGALGGATQSAELSLAKSDILSAQMSLEEAIARVETEALRAEDVRAAPRSAPHPVAPAPKDRRGALARMWSLMLRGRLAESAGAHFAEPAIDAPRIAEPRIVGPRTAGPRNDTSRVAEPRVSEAPPHPAGPPPHPKGRDTWLTDLLARASREEDEGGEAIAPPPKIRRIR